MKDKMEFSETKNRIDRALTALKTELAKVQEQDFTILQQFLRIQHDINKLSGQRDPYPRSGSVNSILLSVDDPQRKYSWNHRLISRQQSVPVNAGTIAEDVEVDFGQDQLSTSFNCIVPDDTTSEIEVEFNLEQEMKEILPELPVSFQRQISRSDLLSPCSSTVVNVQLSRSSMTSSEMDQNEMPRYSRLSPNNSTGNAQLSRSSMTSVKTTQQEMSEFDKLSPFSSAVSIELSTATSMPSFGSEKYENVSPVKDKKQSDEKHPLRLLSLIEESGRENNMSQQLKSHEIDEVDNVGGFNTVNLRRCDKQDRQLKQRPKSGGETLSWYLENISLNEKELPNTNNNYVKQRPLSADMSSHVVQRKRNEYELSLVNYLKRSSELWKDVQMDKAENGVVDEKKLAKLKIFL